jgi:hypothetical protein
MKNCVIPLTVALLAPSLHADTFGTGLNRFDIPFTTIGNPGNPADPSPNPPLGAVAYAYRIGNYEVSRGMIEKYNALNPGKTISMSDMHPYGGNGPDKPATGVTWNQAAVFVNWLNTSKGYPPAYKFTSSGTNDNIALWAPGDPGYDPANPFRNSDAHYFLPSENEWHKAAYYDPNANGGTGGYWNYATGSNSAPTAVASGTATATAVYGQTAATGPANITNSGGLSPYGTMAQNGNAWEWCESGINPPNNVVDEARVVRGGYWFSGSGALVASDRYFGAPGGVNFVFGFRVASKSGPPPFALDGLADSAGYLLSNAGMTLYAAVRGNDLYVATWAPGGAGNDHFIFVGDSALPSATAPAPWSKAGTTALPEDTPFLGGESDNDFMAWTNANGADTRTGRAAGQQMEGVIDLAQAFGGLPENLYLAALAYQTADGGVLAAQAPAQVGVNGDVDPGEILVIPLAAIRDEDGNGTYDRLESGKGFVITSYQKSGNQFSLTWNCFPGRTYRIEGSPDMTAGSWETVPGSTLTAGPQQMSATQAFNLDPGDTERFFRVALDP